VHSIASVGSNLTPLVASTAISSLLVEVGDGNLVSVQDRVEINRDDVSGVEVTKREVVVTNGIIWASNPLYCVVETTLSAASKVSVQGFLLLEAEFFAARVDFARFWRVVGFIVGGDVIFAVRLWSRSSVGYVVSRGYVSNSICSESRSPYVLR
jgi:hypothetical protein